MICLSLSSTDPYFNLAADEYFLKNSREEFLILGINERSVIIGKHQAAHREICTKVVYENNFPVIRRISGGGTVFHDPGNLNFAFILNSEEGKQINFKKYTFPVVSFLSALGIDAKFEAKNDLRVGGLKISGNAEHVYRDRILHHGTLLFNTDIEMMKSTLRKDTTKYETRAVSSHPSAVTNLAGMLKGVDSIYEFRLLMLNWFLENNFDSSAGELSGEETEKIRLLADTKYRTWDWNYAYGPEYHFSTSFDHNKSLTYCSLHIKDGIIREIEIKGSPSLERAVKELVGCRHMPDDILQVLEKENIFKAGFDIYNLF